MKVINNSQQLKQHMQKIMTQVLEETALKINDVITEFLQNWYDDYTPTSYKRTEQLLNSCTTSQVFQAGNNFAVQVYINYNAMHHNLANDITELDIVQNAERGIHGVKYGRLGNAGVGFWKESIDEIKNNKIIIKAFTEFMISKGFNVEVN